MFLQVPPQKDALETLHKLAELLAYLLAAGFFGFKWISGYMSTNLSLEISCTRKQSAPETDLLAITVVLTKGDRGSLHIFDVGIKVNKDASNLRKELEPDAIKKDRTTPENRRYINWAEKDPSYCPFLQAGEKTQIALSTEVPRSGPCHIQVVVVGRRKLSYRVKQWRASAVSLPN